MEPLLLKGIKILGKPAHKFVPRPPGADAERAAKPALNERTQKECADYENLQIGPERTRGLVNFFHLECPKHGKVSWRGQGEWARGTYIGLDSYTTQYTSIANGKGEDSYCGSPQYTSIEKAKGKSTHTRLDSIYISIEEAKAGGLTLRVRFNIHQSKR